MKTRKIILFLLGCFLLSHVSVVRAETPIKIKIVIGIKIARKRDCKGLGFCEVDISNIKFDDDDKNEGVVIGTAMFTGNHSLEIEFDKSKGMSAEAYERYFQSGLFVFEDEFPMPKDALEKLGYPDEFIIPAGKYEVIEEDDLVRMVINN